MPNCRRREPAGAAAWINDPSRRGGQCPGDHGRDDRGRGPELAQVAAHEWRAQNRERVAQRVATTEQLGTGGRDESRIADRDGPGVANECLFLGGQGTASELGPEVDRKTRQRDLADDPSGHGIHLVIMH